MGKRILQTYKCMMMFTIFTASIQEGLCHNTTSWSDSRHRTTNSITPCYCTGVYWRFVSCNVLIQHQNVILS